MITSMLDVPVLMYHRVNPVVIDRNTVHVDNFKQQLEYLASRGYQAITLTQLRQSLDGQGALPAKPVILTFDDGYKDNFDFALPLLMQYDMKATVFVVAGCVGGFCSWLKEHDCNRLMTWEQLGKWVEAGMEIGGHTMTHPFLSRLNEQAIKHELLTSKELLESKLNSKIAFFCYPYGDFDDRVKTLVRQAGYQGGLAIYNRVSLTQPDIYAIPRQGISARLPLWEFKLKVSGCHRLFIGMRIIEHRLKAMLRRRHG